MRIFFDRNVEPRYIQALEQKDWSYTAFADDHFSQSAGDSNLAQYAEKRNLVVFTRDSDFFELVRHHYDCGLLYFHKRHTTSPSDIVSAVDKIRNQYSDFSQIEEGLPGRWV